MRSRQFSWSIYAVVAVFSCAVSAAAQNQNKVALEELKQYHDRLARPDFVMSIDDARDARKKIKLWNFERATLKPEQQESLLRLELYAALGVGDAAGAQEASAKLTVAAPQKRSTVEAGYLASAAAGSAQGADARLREMLEKASGHEKELVTQRRRWIRQVGTLAPDVTIAAEGESISARQREKRVLVIDFWNTLKQPDQGQLSSLIQVYAENKGSAAFEMVGVNTDSETRVEKARDFAKSSGFAWKQLYEKKVTGAPITHEAFKAGSPPWHVLIDGRGVIRGVGVVSEPAFRYALRAALAETFGEFPAQPPRNVDGEIPEALRPKAAEPEKKEVATGDGGGAAAAGAAAGGAPVSDPAAADLFRQGRLFLKTGKKSEAKRVFQEIVDKYPNSLEAREARDMLANL